VGLGDVHRVGSDTLTALSNRTKGFHATGRPAVGQPGRPLPPSQVLPASAGRITNEEVVKDPTGFITAGAQVQVSLELNGADVEAIIVLMTDIPADNIAIATPAGQVITLGTAQARR
jgi:hypothetical protein